MPKASDRLVIGDQEVGLGETRDIELAVSQTYSGADVTIPLRVIRAPRPGKTVLLTGAVHGDELNGTGIIREILLRQPFELLNGSLVLVPVVNVLGFERQSRYLPDRRDLNRSFPGFAQGSLAGRFAHTFFHQVVMRCDMGIDLHTGGGRRTNFPNVRADMSDVEVARLANAFGGEIVADGAGLDGALRKTACKAGRPTILLEAGEVLKVEPVVVEVGVRGIRNVLIAFGMIEGKHEPPAFRASIERSTWIRSEVGGMLRFHVGAGEIVRQDQPLASVATLLGVVRGILRAPAPGIIMGLTTLPSVKPGDPVVHLAMPREELAGIERALADAGDCLHARLRQTFAESIITEPSPDGRAAGRAKAREKQRPRAAGGTR